MKYFIVMFTSRADTMRFYHLIKNTQAFCSVINTPHSLSRSCGISVKISAPQINLASQIISQYQFASFKGIFEIRVVNNRDIPTRIY